MAKQGLDQIPDLPEGLVPKPSDSCYSCRHFDNGSCPAFEVIPMKYRLGHERHVYVVDGQLKPLVFEEKS